jgi:hypothetical protein
MENMREMNETLVKYMVESTRQAVEFGQKAWTDYVELSKTIMNKVPGMDTWTKNKK